MMLPNVQRAKVESKSQRRNGGFEFGIGCYQMYKELKLKANHNSSMGSYNYLKMLPNVQRAKVESKSQQPPGNTLTTFRCFQMYKELKLKANHNSIYVVGAKGGDVTKCTKS